MTLRAAGPAALQRIARSTAFRVATFDERAAIETAAMTQEALDDGDKRGGSQAPWQKVKIDRQLVAVARVHGVKTLYTDDRNMRGLAERLGLQVMDTYDMPDPAPRQRHLFLDDEG